MTQIRNDGEFRAVLHGIERRWRRAIEETTPRYSDRPTLTASDYRRWYLRQRLIHGGVSCIRRLIHAVTRSGGKKADRATPRAPFTLEGV